MKIVGKGEKKAPFLLEPRGLDYRELSLTLYVRYHDIYPRLPVRMNPFCIQVLVIKLILRLLTKSFYGVQKSLHTIIAGENETR